MERLLREVELLAEKITDGHFTILRFTTGYKVFLGTPNLDTGKEREKIAKMKSFDTLDDALRYLLDNKVNISIAYII